MVYSSKFPLRAYTLTGKTSGWIFLYKKCYRVFFLTHPELNKLQLKRVKSHAWLRRTCKFKLLHSLITSCYTALHDIFHNFGSDVQCHFSQCASFHTDFDMDSKAGYTSILRNDKWHCRRQTRTQNQNYSLDKFSKCQRSSIQKFPIEMET